MLDQLSNQPELRYGCPASDQILLNRYFVVGYSYYFRQAKWALEIIDPDKIDMTTVQRLDNFRPDYRVPKRFRADLSDYKGSGFDRGHLVASANQNDTTIQNSETFLLTNMSPQKGELNRKKWRILESAVRELDNKKTVLETYVITGPIFDFTQKTAFIGKNDANGVKIPIPTHFFKCILTETQSGRLNMWAFEVPNKKLTNPLDSYRVKTSYIEQRAGLNLWSNLTGPEIEREKSRVRKMWKYDAS